MFCFITKWMVSRSHDTGKPLSGAAARHIERCGECSAFARATESLSTGLRRDAREFLRGNGTALDDKILSTLIAEPKPVRVPRRRFMPVPAFAAAVLVVLITAAVLFRTGPVSTAGPGAFPAIDVPGTMDTPDVLRNVTNIAVKVESPIETEMRSLEQSVKSAAQTLLSGLDPKIKG